MRVQHFLPEIELTRVKLNHRGNTFEILFRREGFAERKFVLIDCVTVTVSSVFLRSPCDEAKQTSQAIQDNE